MKKLTLLIAFFSLITQSYAYTEFEITCDGHQYKVDVEVFDANTPGFMADVKINNKACKVHLGVRPYRAERFESFYKWMSLECLQGKANYRLDFTYTENGDVLKLKIQDKWKMTDSSEEEWETNSNENLYCDYKKI